MQKTTHFTCIRVTNTEGLNIDKSIHQHSRVFQFELGKIYSVYGDISGSKAIYENIIGDIDYEDKFKGWVTPEFLYKNFVTDKDIIEIDNIAKEIYENS
jgi:hypothetical protein